MRCTTRPGGSSHATWHLPPTQAVPFGQGTSSLVQMSSPFPSKPGHGPLWLANTIQSPRSPLALTLQKFALQHSSQSPFRKASGRALQVPAVGPRRQPHRQLLGRSSHCCSVQGGQAEAQGSAPTKNAQQVGTRASLTTSSLAHVHVHGVLPPTASASHEQEAPQMPLAHSDHDWHAVPKRLAPMTVTASSCGGPMTVGRKLLWPSVAARERPRGEAYAWRSRDFTRLSATQTWPVRSASSRAAVAQHAVQAPVPLCSPPGRTHTPSSSRSSMGQMHDAFLAVQLTPQRPLRQSAFVEQLAP
mmetsp:Transcript_1380/g.4465  ORF Transcript_1380/g.4465 Transcript_1380/m.4465 type:complete len:302 (-) Transcript_1380:173-1078(-)